MKNVKDAKMQLEEEAFNGMPGRKAVEKIINTEGGIDIVDTGEAYWVNANDTLVVAISANSMSEWGLKIAHLLHSTKPDEFDYQFDNTTKSWVCRLWWD